MEGSIENILNQFPEVAWDRFIGSEDDLITIFGWIRRDDQKLDFVVLNIKDHEVIWCLTSSAKYTTEFNRRITHQDCKPVEDVYKSVNYVNWRVKKGFVQTQNPITNEWVKINRDTGRIVATSNNKFQGVEVYRE